MHIYVSGEVAGYCTVHHIDAQILSCSTLKISETIVCHDLHSSGCSQLAMVINPSAVKQPLTYKTMIEVAASV